MAEGIQPAPGAPLVTGGTATPQKHGILSGTAIIFRIVGWVVLVGGSLFSIAMAVMASQGVAAITGLLNIIPGIAEVAGAGVAIIALGGIISSLLCGLFLLAFGDLCDAVIDIEKRTR
ncbi:MAG TPA: hypothetical protein G4O12_07045 [Dehalococcoidia bacterium]|nr:hypothetical protein [Dehalococcoidia bacterium]